MAYPQIYAVSYSFTGWQNNAPATPLPAQPLDNEFLNIATSLASVISAIQDIRRADGALKNGVVTFDSFEQGLQLLLDPTNGQLVAAAVASAQAAAVSASGFDISASVHDTAAAVSAAAAAASASTVNLALYLAKANNLAELGSLTTSRANLGLGSVATFDVGAGANNIVQLDGSAKIPAYDGSQLTNVDVLPVGALVWSTNGGSALPGTVKANGALLSRTSFPRLWTYANASSNIVSEAAWFGVNSGSYSTGDLSTTFRIIDARAEFIRAYDDGRGIDLRNFGQRQADSLKDHTHNVSVPNIAGANNNNGGGGGSFAAMSSTLAGATSGSPSTGAAVETRPRNIALLACIKF